MKNNIKKDLQNGKYYDSLKNYLLHIQKTCYSQTYSPYTTTTNKTTSFYYSRGGYSSDTNYLDFILPIVLPVGLVTSVILCCCCRKNKKGQVYNSPSGGQSIPKNTNLSFSSYGGGAASIGGYSGGGNSGGGKSFGGYSADGNSCASGGA